MAMEQSNTTNAWDALNSNAHWGTRALINLMHLQRLPNSYTDDVAIDVDLLYRQQPRFFVVVLRENGCDIGVPHLTWTQERIRFCGRDGDARIFTVEVHTDEQKCRSFKIDRTSIEAAMEWLRRKEAEFQDCIPDTNTGSTGENSL